MLRTTATEYKYSAAFIIAFFTAYISSIIIQFGILRLYIEYLPSMLYCFIAVAWAASIVQRIAHKPIRRYIIAIALMLLLLFTLRICRYVLFMRSPVINRYLWYLYYIPFIAMPMLSLSAAHCVGRDSRAKLSLPLKVAWVITVILIIMILTNDLHHLALTSSVRADGINRVIYRPLYYIIFIWSFAVALGSYILLMRKCRLSTCRKQWYIPLVPSSIALALIAVYYAGGGTSPEILGCKLYNIQEIYLALFIGLWEGCIMIGLIPSNTCYNRLFEITHINAEIKNSADETVYRSGGYLDTKGDENFNRKTYSIRGGSITWNEDISALNLLNSEIMDLTEQLEDENVLIEEENRYLSEKAKNETRNRLYDRIARHIHPQLLKIEHILDDDIDPNQKMRQCLLLGTYVKRCSNLMLLAESKQKISTDELYLSISESLEQTDVFDIVCELTKGFSAEISPGKMIAAYDLFEYVLEHIIDNAEALSVKIYPDEDTLLSLETDVPVNIDELSGTLRPELSLCSFIEDDIQHISLKGGRPE